MIFTCFDGLDETTEKQNPEYVEFCAADYFSFF